MVCDQRLEDRLEFGLGLLLAERGQGWRRKGWKSKWRLEIKKLGGSGKELNERRRTEKWTRRGRVGTRGVSFEDRV